MRKADAYKIWRREWNKNISTLTEVDETIHAQKKKRLFSIFTDRSIRWVETYIVGHVDSFCDLLVSHQSHAEPVDLAPLADYLIFRHNVRPGVWKVFRSKSVNVVTFEKRAKHIWQLRFIYVQCQ